MPTPGRASVLLGDLNDFITPSQACVRPLPDKNELASSNAVRSDLPPQPAKLSLNDCLACSGCVTTAETVLISEQSTEEFLQGVRDPAKITVVSVSVPARCSIAAQYKLSAQQALRKLTTFFKTLGVMYVLDCALGVDIGLKELGKEFVTCFTSAMQQANANIPSATSPQKLPLISSSCPGWVCYAEKTHGAYILPHLAKTKSPQQIMGSLVKHVLAEKLNKRPNDIYHVTVMPCYDKKLEASRDDFYNAEYQTRDVDCVLTALEVQELLELRNLNLADLDEAGDVEVTGQDAPLDGDVTFESLQRASLSAFFAPEGFGSGGHLEYVYRYAANQLFGIQLKSDVPLQYVARNGDFREVALEVNGKRVLVFAQVYGFRNIQNLVRKMKSKTCPYQFVEVMACPSGCLNGGGQIKAVFPETSQQVLARVTQVHTGARTLLEPSSNPNPVFDHLYDLLITDGDKSTHFFHTEYHAREKPNTNPLLIKW